MSEQKSQILVVDDNPEIREIIQVLLGGEGYEVAEAADGQEALAQIRQCSFDLIILDIMLPGMNGYQACRAIREQSNAPILFLSARGQDQDKTLGFSSGGDDYLTKPFSYHELLGRVKALIRRYQVYRGKAISPQEDAPAAAPLIRCRGLEIDPSTEEVRRDGRPLDLTDTEYAVLLLLVTNRGQLFSAARLYEAIWNEPYYYGANNTVMVHIRNLRRKVEQDPANPTLIKTVWGKGYRCE